MPCYNCDKYISRCIDSLLIQTHSNNEIILVDDGSTDNSSMIMKAYASRYSNIKYLITENQGIGAARNTGIKASKGDYIAFIDADDWVEAVFIEKLLYLSINYDSDISECSFFFNYENSNKQIIHKIVRKTILITGQNIKPLVGANELMSWNKLYKRKIIENVQYPKGIIHEDLGLTLYLISKCKIIVKTSEPLIHYFQRKTSVLNTYNLRKYDIFDSCEYLFNLFMKEYSFDYYKNELLHRLLKSFAYLSVRIKPINFQNSCELAGKAKSLRTKYFEEYNYKGSIAYTLIDRMLHNKSPIVNYILLLLLNFYKIIINKHK